MKLLIEPDAGIGPIISAVQKARRSVSIVIFRFDSRELEKALTTAVTRGVQVRALVAHTNRSGEALLRKLELRLLGAGVTVARTADDLVRYHDKFMIVDERTLYVFAFNYTRLDMKSRSAGLMIRQRPLVADAVRLFEADSTRQPWVAGCDDFVVSPVNARARLISFIRKAQRELLIYDPKIADGAMIRLLLERARAGVAIRVIGKMAQRGKDLPVVPLRGLRLHLRAMVRDRRELFIGSQSLRSAELDRRRELGVIVREPSVVKQMRELFESDWAESAAAKASAAVAAAAPPGVGDGGTSRSTAA